MSHFGYAPAASKGVASSSVAAANAFHRYQSQKAGPSTDIELEDGWAAVHLDGICKLQRILERGKGTFPNKEYIQLYTTVYAMCTQKNPKCWSHQLYERFEQSLNEYLCDTVLPALQRTDSGDAFIRELVHRWELHLLMRRWMGAFFSYLNRFYVKRYNKRPLEDVCIVRFKVLIYEVIRKRATAALIDLIDRGRAGENVDHSLLRRAIEIFIAMGMGSLSHYEVDFIGAFLEATSVFYAREAAHWLQNDTCPTFLLKVEARLNQERRRLEDFLHVSTHDKLFEVLHQQLLLKHQEAVLTKETGIKAMLRARATQDITRMYKLYAAVPSSLPFIARLFKELVISVGEELIARLTAENDSGKYIEELLSMHDRFYELTTTCFDDAGVFHFALKDAFEHIVNLAAMGSSTAELLSSFCDKLLTKGGIENEGALQESLDKVVKIFTYLTDKDLFSDFYRKQLAKRLLMLRSVSNDAERSLIGKLKLKCGAQFTSKFEGMMNDMNLGADTTALFEQWMLTERASCGFEMSVQVLTTGFWPSYKSEAVNLPHEMTRSTTIFQRFYDTRTAHRRLAWIHHLGTATVGAFYGQQPVDVVCSTYQCLILLLFNGLGEISIEDVGKVTGIPKEDVKQALRPLVMGQYKLLVKDPVEGFSTSHKIRVNTAFTSPKRQIKIPLLNNKVSDEERSKTVADVSEERIHVIEACIVRLMKARQTMDHQQLVSEVTQQMVLSAQFRPDPKAIKKRIEDLITREYMERVTSGANTSYKYMA